MFVKEKPEDKQAKHSCLLKKNMKTNKQNTLMFVKEKHEDKQAKHTHVC